MAITNGALRRAFQSGRGLSKALDTQRADTVANLASDANTTINARTAADFYVTADPLTAGRSITLTNGQAGDSIVITRTAASTGEFDLTVAGKALVAGAWAIVVHDGTDWYVAASGTL